MIQKLPIVVSHLLQLRMHPCLIRPLHPMFLYKLIYHIELILAQRLHDNTLCLIHNLNAPIRILNCLFFLLRTLTHKLNISREDSLVVIDNFVEFNFVRLCLDDFFQIVFYFEFID